MNLLQLPDLMIEQIFEFLPYDEIAKKRLVCRRIDRICQRLLNRGFSKMIMRHSANLKRIKALLPRRESERRNHPLARHTDILTCIETRISMLSMTYSKYMELNLCCFIPGKVIDEVFRILRLVEITPKPLRAHEVLQELRDISSMAIEHFDEKIAHLLKRYLVDSSHRIPTECSSQRYQTDYSPPRYPPDIILQRYPPDCSSQRYSIDVNAQRFTPENITSASTETEPRSTNTPTTSVGHLRNLPPLLLPLSTEVTYRCEEAKINRQLIQKMKQKYKVAMRKFNQLIQLHQKQTVHLRQISMLITALNGQVTELKKRVEETDAKNREISANISQITGEPCPNPTSTSPIQKRNIKPRTATIILKRRIAESTSTAATETGGESAKKTKTE